MSSGAVSVGQRAVEQQDNEEAIVFGQRGGGERRAVANLPNNAGGVVVRLCR